MCYKKSSSAHDIATALMNSLQQWPCTRAGPRLSLSMFLHGKEWNIGPCTSFRNICQLMIARIEIVVFFSSVDTSKLSMILQ